MMDVNKSRVKSFDLSYWTGEVSCLPRCDDGRFVGGRIRNSFGLGVELRIRHPRDSPSTRV